MWKASGRRRHTEWTICPFASCSSYHLMSWLDGDHETEHRFSSGQRTNTNVSISSSVLTCVKVRWMTQGSEWMTLLLTCVISRFGWNSSTVSSLSKYKTKKIKLLLMTSVLFWWFLGKEKKEKPTTQWPKDQHKCIWVYSKPQQQNHKYLNIIVVYYNTTNLKRSANSQLNAKIAKYWF